MPAWAPRGRKEDEACARNPGTRIPRGVWALGRVGQGGPGAPPSTTSAMDQRAGHGAQPKRSEPAAAAGPALPPPHLRGAGPSRQSGPLPLRPGIPAARRPIRAGAGERAARRAPSWHLTRKNDARKAPPRASLARLEPVKAIEKVPAGAPLPQAEPAYGTQGDGHRPQACSRARLWGLSWAAPPSHSPSRIAPAAAFDHA